MPEYTQRIWFIPQGKKTIFSTQKAEIKVTPERISVLAEGQELFSAAPSATTAKPSFGTVRFTRLDGEKNSIFSGPFLYLYNPAWNFLSVWIAIFKVGKARALAKAINEAAGPISS